MTLNTIQTLYERKLTTYPPEWTPELDAFAGDTVVEKGLNRTYENLRNANERGVTLTIGSDSFSFVTPYGYVTIDEMYDFVEKAGVTILETIKAACFPALKAAYMARPATTVFPLPTSPCKRRFI